MSDYKKEAKAASAAKMQRMGLKLEDGSRSFDDMNGGKGLPMLNSGNRAPYDKQRSRFKRGGKVVEATGEATKKNLGKSPRKKRDAGGNIPMPTPRPAEMDKKTKAPVPLPPRRNLPDEYTAYNPNEPNDLTSKTTGYRRGGMTAGNPAARKKMAAAIAYKNQGSGMSSKMGIPNIKGMPNLAADSYIPHKKGGAAKHPDEAEDKKLVKKMVKPTALRSHKADGGSSVMDEYNKRQKELGESVAAKKAANPGKSFMDIMLDEVGDLGKRHGEYLKSRRQSNEVPANRRAAMDAGRDDGPDLGDVPGRRGSLPMLSGLKTKNFAHGGRPHRATGGRTKGKTNVNIIISPQSGGQNQQPLGAGVGMGQPPVPPMMPPVPPQMPPQGMGAPAGAGPGLGALAALAGGRPGMSAPMPPMRKSGGRVGKGMPTYQEKDYGSGSGLGRLVKKKWPPANGTE